MKSYELLVPINGFTASAVQCGIKKRSKDLGLIYCKQGAVVAGVFGKKSDDAASARISMENLSSTNVVKALLLNSGNSNSKTGEIGLDNCRKKIDYLASKLSIHPSEILVGATGPSGQQLEMPKLYHGIADCSANLAEMGLYHVPEALATAPGAEKVFTLRYCDADNKTITLTGIGKGPDAFHTPDAATLCVVLTDATIEHSTLQNMVHETVKTTFNVFSNESCSSGRDMAVVLSSCAADNRPISALSSENAELFKTALHQTFSNLATQIESGPSPR